MIESDWLTQLKVKDVRRDFYISKSVQIVTYTTFFCVWKILQVHRHYPSITCSRVGIWSLFLLWNDESYHKSNGSLDKLNTFSNVNSTDPWCYIPFSVWDSKKRRIVYENLIMKAKDTQNAKKLRHGAKFPMTSYSSREKIFKTLSQVSILSFTN